MSGSHRPCRRLARSSVEGVVIVPSPHGVRPETGPIKKPRPDGGAFGIARSKRAGTRDHHGSPVGELFSTTKLRTNAWSYAEHGCGGLQCQSAQQTWRVEEKGLSMK